MDPSGRDYVHDRRHGQPDSANIQGAQSIQGDIP
jgi:hypothetical protein